MKAPRTPVLAGMVAIALAGLVAYTAQREKLARQTEAQITAQQARVAALARQATPPRLDPEAPPALAGLPEPVQRYLRFALRGPVPAYHHVRLSLAGEYVRPGSDTLRESGAELLSAAAMPAQARSATLGWWPGLTARAWQLQADAPVTSAARLASLFDVDDAAPGAAQDQAGLRCWLADTPLHPVALLPGGPVRWEAVDAHSARAHVSWRGRSVSLVARFAPDGALLDFHTEAAPGAPGGADATPGRATLHDCGDQVARSDYRLIEYQMVPMEVTASRRTATGLQPFWRATVEDIAFE